MNFNELNYLFDDIKIKYEELLIKINDVNNLKKNNLIINKFKNKIFMDLIELNEKVDKSLININKISNDLELIEVDNEVKEEIKNYQINEKVYKKFLIPMLIYKQKLLNK